MEELDRTYKNIAKYKGEDVVVYSKYGDFQGSFILITFKDGVLRIYKDFFGSCATCDNYLNFIDYRNDVPKSEIEKFWLSYIPFLEKPIETLTYQELKDGIYMNNKNYWEFSDRKKQNILRKVAEKFGIK